VPLLLGDNKGAVQLTEGPSKHIENQAYYIDTEFHHVIDEVKEGRIEVYYVPGKDMLADGMTKPLPRKALEMNRSRIGIGLYSMNNFLILVRVWESVDLVHAR
jgi:hypothetical protein